MSLRDIIQIPVLQDNYIYLLHDPKTEFTACIDPAKAEPVLEALSNRNWKLTCILNTHHHADHVGGNRKLKEVTGCHIYGFGPDAARIPGIDYKLQEGDHIQLGSLTAEIFFIPGHTAGHIAYYFKEWNTLFCGDTLFSIGCGRLFEGTPAQMWNSLQQIRRLPDETALYCTHEYTQQNINFALSIDSDNETLKKRAQEVLALRAHGMPTVPSRLGDEKKANPFLRADDPNLKALVGMSDRTDEDVFAEIRRRKDVF